MMVCPGSGAGAMLWVSLVAPGAPFVTCSVHGVSFKDCSRSSVQVGLSGAGFRCGVLSMRN